MNRTLLLATLFVAMCLSVLATFSRAEFPKPNPYPISWELKFDYAMPRRIVVDVPGRAAPVAYWYLTYTVTNNTDQERTFLPFFEMVTTDGKVIRSDKNIPELVFNTIKEREKKSFLEPWTKIGGELRLGEDQARDGVAIWEEPTPRMGRFNIFVGSLSGEAVTLKDDAGNPQKDKNGDPVILRKTLQLNYHIRGDEVYPGEDDVNTEPREWVMR